MPEGRKQTFASITLGWVIILAFCTIAFASIYYIYSKFFKPSPTMLSLAAYFVDEKGNPSTPSSPDYDQSHLKIQGNVYHDGALKKGEVRLTVSNGDGSFRQSIPIEISETKAGTFDTDDPALRSVHPGDQIQITADVMSSELPGGRATEEIHLNSAPPANKLWLEIGSIVVFLVLAVIFFYAFTGRKTARKNRTAIIFSYVIMAIALALPMFGPIVLVHVFPRSVDGMIGAPAGLINTHTANLAPDQTEWALNIGGYSFKAPAKIADAKGVSAGNTGNSNTTKTAGIQTEPATAPRNLSPSSQQSSSTVEGETQSVSGSPPSSKPAAEKSLSPDSNPEVVKVQGGLVIPLSVIILSVIGGAINMTRKVPGFQKESEDADFPIGATMQNPASAVGGLVRLISGSQGQPPPAKATEVTLTIPDGANTPLPAKEGGQDTEKKAEPSLKDQAEGIDKEIDSRITDQVSRNRETEANVAKIRSLLPKMEDLFKSKKTDGPLFSKFNSYDDWLTSEPRLREMLGGSWRSELLNQYMYLISAPFLAIVSYYIIDLVGLNKQGVVVVIAFSVGLVSEKIVSWILGIATGYMTNPKNSPVTSNK